MLKRIVSQEEAHQLTEVLRELEATTSVNSILMYVGADVNLDVATLQEQLRQMKTTVIGAVFPEVIIDGQRFSDKSIILGLREEMASVTILDFDEVAIEDKITTAFDVPEIENASIFIFIDALVRGKSQLLDTLYNLYGSLPNYLGGGAGSLAFRPFPCIISNAGVTHGSAVVALMPKPITLGIAHGWKPISEPMKVTEAEGNQVISLNWQPAMSTYQKIVEEHAGKAFDFGDFFNATKSYPFGIQKLNDEMIVRDPFQTENERIFLLDDIEEGSFVQILYGDLESLIAGAGQARQAATDSGNLGGGTLIIDCISRVLFMGDHFERELLALDPEANAFGALTLGEIANNGDSYLDVYNKTAVVGLLEQ
ncbi:FIST signal transduction protein [Lewinella sp. W8]|uniref:FIST signal transduction protein n=1 Tax=Lewinella sp. W8 TaxID=2528208 RepID=UPI001567B58B|nr:FIST N-terminal domain-containing protein [Lewinella sp. W8]